MGTMACMEQWKPIAGFEGHYEVSDYGRVRTIGGGIKGHSRSNDGRLSVNLWRDGKQKLMKVHRLVLHAFKGPCPEGMEGCHNDGNPAHNHIDNLRWDTHQANILDRIKHGTSNRGERCGTAKLTLEQVRAIRADTRKQQEIADQYGVTNGTVSRIKAGVRWAHDR